VGIYARKLKAISFLRRNEIFFAFLAPLFRDGFSKQEKKQRFLFGSEIKQFLYFLK